MIRALALILALALFAQVFAYDNDCPGCMTDSESAAEQLEDYSEDFTDSGVGCMEDCLEPALEPFTSPDTVPEEYTLNNR